MNEATRQRLRMAVRFFYDLQLLRIQTGLRAGKPEVILTDHDEAFLDRMSGGMRKLEREALAEVKGLLKGVPIYEGWLKDQKGVGPTMAGVILSEFDIHKANTASKFWAFAGLITGPDGKAIHRIKGQKSPYNSWLRSKLVAVLAGCMLKSNSPWRKFYDDYKHRKESMRVPTCMQCNGSGRLRGVKDDAPEEMEAIQAAEIAEELAVPAEGTGTTERAGIRERTELNERAVASEGTVNNERAGRRDGTDVAEHAGKKERPVRSERANGKAKPCFNCAGTGGPAPWGKSQKHRHQASMRYMTKMFVAQLWEEWRRIEGLPGRVPYREEYLGMHHHAE